MAMCLRCMQEGKYVDADTCDHNVTLTTHEAEKPADDKKDK